MTKEFGALVESAREVEMPDNEMSAGTRIENPSDRMTAGVHEAVGAEHEHALDWREIVRIGFVAIAAGAFWFAGAHLGPPLVLAGVICALVGGYPIFHEAIENILERRMTMELSMAIAIVAALAHGGPWTGRHSPSD